MTTTQDKLIKKIVEILADYKFNSTQIETAEMTAERIINIINQKAIADFIEMIDKIKKCKFHNKKISEHKNKCFDGDCYIEEEELKQMLIKNE
jgi:hypothetical protein